MSDFVPPNLPMEDDGHEPESDAVNPPAAPVSPQAPKKPAPVVVPEKVENKPNTNKSVGGAKVLGGKVVDAPSALDAGKIKVKSGSTAHVGTSTVPTDALAPGTSASEPAPLQQSFVTRHKFLVGLVLVLIVAGIVLVGMSLILRDSNEQADRMENKLDPQPVETSPIVDDMPVDDVDPALEEEVEDVVEDVKEEDESDEEQVESLVVDPDGDGLVTTKELLAGTDPYRSDTDDDGLTDKEELNIWKTDPLDVDTDDDTFSDGDEVRHGYNPLGDGRLFDVPKQP